MRSPWVEIIFIDLMGRLRTFYIPKEARDRGLADVRIDERTSALGHINLNPLWVHREHIIGLAPFQGNPTPPFGGGKPHILSPSPSHFPTVLSREVLTL